MKTPGTYISVYPRLDQVFDFLQKKLKAKEVGLLYSSSQNTEIALSFKKAADAHGVVLHPLSVASAGDLARALKQSLPKIDALVLAVDPILFDRQNLKSIVAEATAAKKPTIGFLEGLPALGVTVTLLSDPAAAAAAAVAAAESPAAAGKKTVDVESSVVIFSRKSAQAIGIDAEASGATKIE